MEQKHFSHQHGLVLHQLQPGSEVQCSGCKSSGSGTVYVCWQCSYFLHERCFRATRSLRNASHPLHPLSLLPYPTHQSNTFFCNSCNLVGSGFSYCCAECDFDLHVHCATSAAMNPAYPPTQHNPFPNYLPPSGGQIPSFTAFPPAQTGAFPNPAVPSGLPSYAAPSAPPHVPQTPAHHPVDFAPVPSTQPNPEVPIYTPPVATITITAPPPPAAEVPVATTTTTAPPPVPQPTPQSNTSDPKPPPLIKHFSHPHVLLPMELDKTKAKVCSACECALSGSAYCCTEANCPFNLHKACFDSPIEVRHKCHLDHPLTLLTAPPYNDGFTCNACLKDGKAFAYHCGTCSYDLHIDCITWPETVTRPDHKHNLNLYYSSPASNSNQEEVFMCDVCKNPVHEMAWLYYCRDCDYGTHLECVASGLLPDATSEQTEEDLLRETQLKFAVLQLLLNGGLSPAKS